MPRKREQTDAQNAARFSDPGKYVSDRDLADRYAVSRASIWRWSASGRLPRPIQLSPGCTRWRVGEIEQYEAGLEAARMTAA